MKFEDHCRICEAKLGDRFEKVNRWLDQLRRVHGDEHRKFRHNLEGVEHCRKVWGDKAALAATLHIMADLEIKEPREIPKDAGEYLRKGYH